ncbi:Xaa-Pro peptidase family protein [soil metagenome]
MHEDRRARVHAQVRSLDLHALIVTHQANLRYLTGLNASAGALIVGAEASILVVDFRYAATAQALAEAEPGLTVAVADGAIDVALVAALQRMAARRVGVEGEHFTVARFNRLSSALAAPGPRALASESPVPTLVTTERVIERMRAVKDAAEICTLREAGRRISAVAGAARAWVTPGRTEQAIAAAVDAAMRDAGFERPAFETIVASGPNGALPHARPTGRVVGEGDGVLLDFGGVYGGYCVDLTRTLHIGPMPATFRRLFEAVREAQAAAIAAVRADVLPADVDGAARRVLEAHGFGSAFGHGTGHGLGLEVHEEPRVSPQAPVGEPLRAGMVITIEPGAYVAGVGGVRIEDDVLVTEAGCELLTQVPIEF